MEDSVNRHSVECSGTPPDAASGASADARDAARYRYLRVSAIYSWMTPTITQAQYRNGVFQNKHRLLLVEEADEAIDAVMTAHDLWAQYLTPMAAPVDVTERSTE